MHSVDCIIFNFYFCSVETHKINNLSKFTYILFLSCSNKYCLTHNVCVFLSFLIFFLFFFFVASNDKRGCMDLTFGHSIVNSSGKELNSLFLCVNHMRRWSARMRLENTINI